MRIENDGAKWMGSELMLGPKPSYPWCEAIRTSEEGIVIHMKQRNVQRPPCLTETKLEQEASCAFNHHSVESFRATVGLGPARCAFIVCQRPGGTDSSCSRSKLKGCIRPPAPHRWYVVIELMRRIHDGFRIPGIRRVGHAEARPLIMDV